MKIRRATDQDVGGVARVHVETWQIAYRGIVPDSYLDGLSVEKREIAWKDSISCGSPELWVAEDEGAVIGWAAFGPSRDEDAAPNDGELHAIYVAPSHWSTGVGRELWLVARKRLLERNYSSATLWVLVDNLRATRFYYSAGFRPNPSTEKTINLGGKELIEIRYEAKIG